MTTRNAENYVNYQERATEFAPGDIVVPAGHDDADAGRVTAVWPGIGMVDVEFTAGNKRYPVEDLLRINPEQSKAIPPFTDSTPGGGGTVSVPGGPNKVGSSRRVAEAFVKKALYWSGADRQYKATTAEVATGHYLCPKCRTQGIESVLKPAIYKRRGGVSERLLGCGNCLFLVKKSDIVNCPDNESEVLVEEAA